MDTKSPLRRTYGLPLGCTVPLVGATIENAASYVHAIVEIEIRRRINVLAAFFLFRAFERRAHHATSASSAAAGPLPSGPRLRSQSVSAAASQKRRLLITSGFENPNVSSWSQRYRAMSDMPP